MREHMNSRLLKDRAGKVFGAFDSQALDFDRYGRRPWRPQACPAADIAIEIDAPQMVDLGEILPGYTRLR